MLPNPKKKCADTPLPQKKLSGRLELAMVTAWQNQVWWLWTLLPLSILYSTIAFIKRQLYQQRILASYRAPVPVMVVGNITVGGSGKTPLIIELLHYLQVQEIKVGVISRGYGGDESLMPCLVTASSRPSEVGDEPCLIVSETGAPVSVCPNRQLAIECLLQHAPDIQLIIADDGLQHYKLARDIEWIVVDSARGFGNKQRLPTGFLREPLSRLDEATVVYHQAHQHNLNDKQTADVTINASSNINSYCNRNINMATDKLTMQLVPATMRRLTLLNAPNQQHQSSFNGLSHVQDNQVQNSYSQGSNALERGQSLTKQTVYGVSGIGYPQRFFETLKDLGFDVIEHPMPDHHQFTAEDLLMLTEHPIVVTTKDAIKIAPLVANNAKLAQLNIWVLPVQAVLSAACYQTLQQQLQACAILKEFSPPSV